MAESNREPHMIEPAGLAPLLAIMYSSRDLVGAVHHQGALCAMGCELSEGLLPAVAAAGGLWGGVPMHTSP